MENCFLQRASFLNVKIITHFLKRSPSGYQTLNIGSKWFSSSWRWFLGGYCNVKNLKRKFKPKHEIQRDIKLLETSTWHRLTKISTKKLVKLLFLSVNRHVSEGEVSRRWGVWDFNFKWNDISWLQSLFWYKISALGFAGQTHYGRFLEGVCSSLKSSC